MDHMALNDNHSPFTARKVSRDHKGTAQIIEL